METDADVAGPMECVVPPAPFNARDVVTPALGLAITRGQGGQPPRVNIRRVYPKTVAGLGDLDVLAPAPGAPPPFNGTVSIRRPATPKPIANVPRNVPEMPPTRREGRKTSETATLLSRPVGRTGVVATSSVPASPYTTHAPPALFADEDVLSPTVGETSATHRPCPCEGAIRVGPSGTNQTVSYISRRPSPLAPEDLTILARTIEDASSF